MVRWHKDDSNALSFTEVCDYWERLAWKYEQRLLQVHNGIIHACGTRTPRKEQYAWHATLEDEQGNVLAKFPHDVWDLEDPKGYFQSVILQERRQRVTDNDLAIGRGETPSNRAGAPSAEELIAVARAQTEKAQAETALVKARASQAHAQATLVRAAGDRGRPPTRAEDGDGGIPTGKGVGKGKADNPSTYPPPPPPALNRAHTDPH